LGTLSEDSIGYEAPESDSVSTASDDVKRIAADLTWLECGDEDEHNMKFLFPRSSGESSAGEDVVRVLSSDFIELSASEQKTEENRFGENGHRDARSTDDESDLIVGANRGSNLAALTHLREKLNTAVQRHSGPIKSQRTSQSELRGLTLENLASTTPESLDEAIVNAAVMSAGGNPVAIRALKESANTDKLDSRSKMEGNSLVESNRSSQENAPVNGATQKTRPERRTVDAERAKKQKSRKLAALSFSFRQEDGDDDPDGINSPDGDEPSSKEAPRSKFRQMASMSKLLRHRNSSVREDRTVPDDQNASTSERPGRDSSIQSAVILTGSRSPRDSNAGKAAARTSEAKVKPNAPSRRQSSVERSGKRGKSRSLSSSRNISNAISLDDEAADETRAPEPVKRKGPISLRNLKVPSTIRLRRKKSEQPMSPRTPSTPTRKRTPVAAAPGFE
jgi:hypothetical protein